MELGELAGYSSAVWRSQSHSHGGAKTIGSLLCIKALVTIVEGVFFRIFYHPVVNRSDADTDITIA